MKFILQFVLLLLFPVFGQTTQSITNIAVQLNLQTESSIVAEKEYHTCIQI